MHDDNILKNELSVLSNKLSELNFALSQQVLPQPTTDNFDEVMKNNEEFLKEFKRKFEKFKRNFTIFVTFLKKTPEKVLLKEPISFKNLVQARNELPKIEEINSVIESLNQFEEVSSRDSTAIVQFLDDLRYFLSGAIKHVNKLESKNIDAFEKHKIDFENKLTTAEQHFANAITSYFENIDEYVVDAVLEQAIDYWTQR